tara:strand:+ start:75 stop:1286 length:1212 start_codon:yes stop_codon:yes gene_type:complete
MAVRIDGTNTTANPGITGADADTGLQFGTDEVSIVTGGTTQATVDSSGRLLVGTSSAWATGNADLLQIQSQFGGNIDLRRDDSSVVAGNSIGSIRFWGNAGDSGEAARIQGEPDGTHATGDKPGRLRFLTSPAGDDAPVERMRIDSSGNVGIGLTNPGDYHANANSLVTSGGITLASTSTGSIYFADSPSGTGEYVGQLNYDHGSNFMQFVVNNGEQMRIDSSGNTMLGGGTVDGQGVLSVKPNSSNGCAVLNFDRASTGANSFPLIFKNAGTTVGSIYFDNSGTGYNTTSDYRVKENVVPLTGAADRLNQLQVRRFNFIADPDTTVDGFLAHEAQAVVPECVTGTKDEVDDDGNPVYQGIDQSKLVPLLTAALQEAMERIETLEAQNASLEARLTALEGGAS